MNKKESSKNEALAKLIHIECIRHNTNNIAMQTMRKEEKKKFE